MMEKINIEQIYKLIDEYVKNELPDAESPYSSDAEIAAGFKYFKRWLKEEYQIQNK